MTRLPLNSSERPASVAEASPSARLDPDDIAAIAEGVVALLNPVPYALLDINEAANALAVSVRTVESLVALGEIPVVRIGTGRGVRRFERRALDAYVRRSTRAL